METKTNIGAIALAVAGNVKAEKQDELLMLGLRYILFHKVPAAAFKKDSGFKRDADYSEKLEAQVVATTQNMLESYFSDVTVVGSRFVKQANAAEAAVNAERRKAFDAMVALDKSIAETMYPEFAEKAAPAEVEAEMVSEG